METIWEKKSMFFDGDGDFSPHVVVNEVMVSSNFGESAYSLAMAFGHFVIWNNFVLERKDEAVNKRGNMAEMKMEAFGLFRWISSAKVMVDEATAVETDGLRLCTGWRTRSLWPRWIIITSGWKLWMIWSLDRYSNVMRLMFRGTSTVKVEMDDERLFRSSPRPRPMWESPISNTFMMIGCRKMRNVCSGKI